MQKEKIIIVDKNDNVINYKYREDEVNSDIYRVSAVMIKNSKGEFLLAQRKLTKKHNPGEWSLSAAGTVEKGETYDENIIHEIEEELGIKNLKLEKIQKLRIYGKHNFFCQFYKSKLDLDIKDFKIQEDEVEKIKWFTKEEIQKGKFEGNIISKTLVDNLEIFL